MMFVAAAANIRCGIFKIEQKTEWKVKEMAGNIIPGFLTLLKFKIKKNFQQLQPRTPLSPLLSVYKQSKS